MIDGVSVHERVREAVIDADNEDERDLLRVTVGEREVLGVVVGERVVLGVMLGDRLALADFEGETEAEYEGIVRDGVFVRVRASELAGDRVGVTDVEAVGDRDDVGELDGQAPTSRLRMTKLPDAVPAGALAVNPARK